MHCLSVQQPSAWALCAGLKDIENRSWTTDHRGRIAIQASLEPRRWRWLCQETANLKKYSPLVTYGVVIGVVDVVDVQPLNQQVEDNPWAEGPYCWFLANPRLIPNPIPLPGKLRLYQLEPEVEAAIERQLQLPPHQVDPQALQALEPHLAGNLARLRRLQLKSYEKLADLEGILRVEKKLPQRGTGIRPARKIHSRQLGFSETS